MPTVYISTQRQLNAFLKRHDHLASSLELSTNVNTTFVLAGVTWLKSLYIDGPGLVVAPELRLVVHELTITNSQCRFSAPKLKEMGQFNVPTASDGYNRNKAFCVIEEYKKRTSTQFKCVLSPKVVVGGIPVSRATITERWKKSIQTMPIPIANDTSYVLCYHPDTGRVTAGCRDFNLDAAIKHWELRTQSDNSDVVNRALMFSLALTNLKDQLERSKR